MFRIRLHIDDIAVLHIIKKFLGVGRVVNNPEGGSSCLFIISDVNNLLTVLLPLIDKYKLYTTKWLDYIDFKFVLLFLANANTTRLTPSQLEWIKEIKNKMNLGRKVYSYELIPTIVINPYWLLGGAGSRAGGAPATLLP